MNEIKWKLTVCLYFSNYSGRFLTGIKMAACTFTSACASHNSDAITFWRHLFCRLTHSDIVLGDHLFNRYDLLFTCEECLSDYSIPVTLGDCVKIFGVIPSGVCILFKSQPRINIHINCPCYLQQTLPLAKMFLQSSW